MSVSSRFGDRDLTPGGDEVGGTDFDSLIGLHSVKGSHYAQFRGVEERLGRVVGALDRISRALVQTAEGPETLVLSVVRAVAEHLEADWVVFALCDGELDRTGPRHLMMDGDGTIYAFEGVQVARTPSHLPDEVLNRLNDILRNQLGELVRPVVADHHLHVPVHLDGRVVGGLSAWTPPRHVVDSADLVVMRILARQAVVALLCSMRRCSRRVAINSPAPRMPTPRPASRPPIWRCRTWNCNAHNVSCRR